MSLVDIKNNIDCKHWGRFFFKFTNDHDCKCQECWLLSTCRSEPFSSVHTEVAQSWLFHIAQMGFQHLPPTFLFVHWVLMELRPVFSPCSNNFLLCSSRKDFIKFRVSVPQEFLLNLSDKSNITKLNMLYLGTYMCIHICMQQQLGKKRPWICKIARSI